MANPKALRTGATIVERGGFPIAASQMRSAADEIERLQKFITLEFKTHPNLDIDAEKLQRK